MPNWRTQVDSAIKNHLEIQIRESAKNKKAINIAPNRSNAQLWCAIANLSKQNFNLELRLKYIEKLLANLLKSKSKPKKKVERKPKKKTKYITF